MSSISKHRVALIGGAGFIGHHLALELTRQGAEVFILDSLQVNNLIALLADPAIENQSFYVQLINQRLELLRSKKIPVVIKDAREYLAVSKFIGDFRPTVVIQLAAVAHANRSNKDPFSTFDHSLRTLENALDSSRDIAEHFIFFSSSMVYGNFPDGFVTEESPCNPLGIYGSLKFAGEKIVQAYNQVFKLPYTIVRPSALYGERCISRRVGQIFIENAVRGNEVCVTGDGKDCLDFTYVQDLVHGIIKVIESDRSKGEIFNLTYGQGRSLTDMARILETHFPDIRVKYIPKDNLTPDRGTLSVEKAKRLLGYEPSWPIERGFANYIEWYKEIVRSSPEIRLSLCAE